MKVQDNGPHWVGLLCQSARTLDKQERQLLSGVAVNEWGA